MTPTCNMASGGSTQLTVEHVEHVFHRKLGHCHRRVAFQQTLPRSEESEESEGEEKKKISTVKKNLLQAECGVNAAQALEKHQASKTERSIFSSISRKTITSHSDFLFNH